MLIYKITNKINGKCYIGQTTQSVEDRFYEHKHKKSCPAMRAAINKYGKENFIVEIIETANNKEDLNKKECFYINHFNTLAPNGYNLTTGGEGATLSEESKNKISQSLKGKSRPKEVCEKVSRSNSGKIRGPYSAEHRAKIGRGNKGKKHSDQARANISAGRRGIRPNRSYVVSADKKIKMSEAGKNLWKSGKLNHLIEYNKKTRKPVTCVETNIDYASLSEAALAFNTTPSSISSVLRGRRKNINGFTFKYKEPHEQV